MHFEEKKSVRKKISAVRNGYQKNWLERKSKIVSGYLVEWPIFKKAKRIFGYLSFGNEVNIDEVLLYALSEGKEVFVPYIDETKDIMQLVRLHSFNDIEYGRYDIRTVKNPELYQRPEDIELVLNPGLSFTMAGGRMGLGKGYYDKFLALAPGSIKIGVTLTPQVVEELPLAEHDVLMDYLVTENGITKCFIS